MTNLTKNNFDKTIASGTVLVDFWAKWCSYCRMIEPVIEEISNKHQNIKIAKVNVDEEKELASRYGVTTLPTFICFKNGIESSRVKGAQPADVLEDMILE